MILVPLRSLSTLAIDGKSRRSGREINKNGFSNEVAWILLFMTKGSTEKVSSTYITSLVHLENGPGCFHIMVIAWNIVCTTSNRRLRLNALCHVIMKDVMMSVRFTFGKTATPL
jgi:hypothetical protein